MRLSTSLMLSAASAAAAVQDQKVLGKKPDFSIDFGTEPHDSESWYAPFERIWGEATEDIKETWDDISMMFPGAFDSVRRAAVGMARKPATRRPDSDYDHHVHGKDVAQIYVENANGESVRAIDGELDRYSLRARRVDTKNLGIDKVKQWAGYLDDNENDKHLFYWFFESRNDPENDPVILWLNGGPGCSSMLGMFFELGPARMSKDHVPHNNPWSWNNNASVIFLEQPVNVGFSYGSSGVSDTVAAGKDAYALLSLFFHQFPEYAHQDFHLSGESYGGHYVPVYAKEILSHRNRNINIKTATVGNGLSDTLRQYPSYHPYACEGKGGYPGVVPEKDCESMKKALPRCLQLIERCYDTESSWTCVPAHIYCNNAEVMPYQETGQNPYDIRDECEDQEHLCYSDVFYYSEYLNKPEIQEAVGAEVSNFGSCNWDVNRDFMLTGDWSKPFYKLTTDVIEEIPMLIYAGDADFICNWMGIHDWTDQLEWSGHDEFAALDLEPLKYANRDEQYGRIKSHGNFTFLQIYGAGHMVPHDQPEAALDMINRWMSGEWF